MKTKLTELLGIEYPIIQGAMAHITDGAFAGAVSEAGGLGVIQSGFDVPEVVRTNISKARSITDKPFAVNLIMESDYVEDNAKVVIEEHVPVVTISAGKPDAIVPMLVSAGVKVIVLVPHVRAAKKMQDMGVSAVIAEGLEGGGHIGRETTMSFVRQVAAAVDIPVIAAGGIADGRGIVAAFALGAEGVQCGTRFLTVEECCIADAYKQRVLDAKVSDTIVTGRDSGHPVRSLKNKFSRTAKQLERDLEKNGEEIERMFLGALRRAVEGDVDDGDMMSGQIAGVVHERKTAREVIDEMISEAEALGALDLTAMAAVNAARTRKI